MTRFTTTLFSLLLSASAFGQAGFSSVEERMTGKEFSETGLHKLSDEELAALNDWLRAHSVATLEDARPGAAMAGTAAATGEDLRGFENTSKMGLDDSDIVARIDGAFTGWDGQTVFRLDNGMIWKQAENDTFYIREVTNPEVTIEQGMWQTWNLSVEGYSKSVRVERIQ